MLEITVGSAEKGYEHCRDPAVYKHNNLGDGCYTLFYTRLACAGKRPTPEEWNDPAKWSIWAVYTSSNFKDFECPPRRISPNGFASPSEVVEWEGRWILTCQTYPGSSRLYFLTCMDSIPTKTSSWSEPSAFLPEANFLSWSDFVPPNSFRPQNQTVGSPTYDRWMGRAIDPTLVVEESTNTLHCYFTGTTKLENAVKHCNLLGHATCQSRDLTGWSMVSEHAPLMGAEVHPEGVENISIIREPGRGRWLMLLSVGLRDQHVAVATSTDLRNWSKLQRCSFVHLSGGGPMDWMTAKHGAPSVWWEENEGVWTLKMALMGEDVDGATSIGIFQSDYNTHDEGNHVLPSRWMCIS